MRGRLTSFVLVVGLLLFAAAIAVSEHGSLVVASEPTTWMDGAPQLTQVSEITKDDASMLGDASCTHMTLPVVRKSYQQLLTNNEPHCMVRTSSGLIDDAVSVWQPRGFSKAYPVDNQTGGYPTVVPVPEYPSALWVKADPVYQGVDVGLYKMLISHLDFNKNILSPRFSLTSPDLMFKYPNNRNMAFMSKGSFSSNGRYWVAEGVSYGFVRVNMTTLQMKTFAENSPRTTSGALLGADAEVSPTGTYATIAYNAPQGWGNKYFKIVDVNSCGDAVQAYSTTDSSCKAVNYWPQLQQNIPGITSVSHVEFATDNSISFVATTGQSPNTRYYLYKMSPIGQPARLEDYLSVGDSFASGEGTFDYIAGTDDGPNKCHQSIFSYPYIISAHTGSLASIACSGAVIRNINGDTRGLKTNQLKGLLDSDIPDGQKVTARAMHTPGIVRQVDFVNQDNPQVVTVSIGGNDVGFSDIIKRCVVPFNDLTSSAQNCYQRYEDRKELVDTINGQFDNLIQTYSGLRSGDPTRRVYVIGYPQLVSPTGDCAVNVRLSQSDREFASQLVDYLDSVIERAAAQAGVYYVDTQHAFDGHKLCEPGDKAANGLTGGHDEALLIGNESYHPNKLGHELFASTILSSTHNLTAPMPKPHTISPPDEDTLAILQAPKSNRVVYEVIHTAQDMTYVGVGGLLRIVPGMPADVALPNSIFQAVLHSDPLELGFVRTDQNGDINDEIRLPADTPVGIHTLHLYGHNIFGEAIDIQQTLYVGASPTDYDGDGVPNAVDSCLGIPQSGQDQDVDGIDDACDPLITDAPSRNGTDIRVITVSTEISDVGAVRSPSATPQTDAIGVQQPGSRALQNGKLGSSVQSVTTPTVAKVLGSFTQKHHAPKPEKASSYSLTQTVVTLIIVSLLGAAGLYRYTQNKQRS